MDLNSHHPHRSLNLLSKLLLASDPGLLVDICGTGGKMFYRHIPLKYLDIRHLLTKQVFLSRADTVTVHSYIQHLILDRYAKQGVVLCACAFPMTAAIQSGPGAVIPLPHSSEQSSKVQAVLG